MTGFGRLFAAKREPNPEMMTMGVIYTLTSNIAIIVQPDDVSPMRLLECDLYFPRYQTRAR